MATISRYLISLKPAFVAAVFAILSSFSPVHAQEGGNQQPFLVPPFFGKPTAISIALNVVAGEKPVTGYVAYGPAGSEERSWRKTTEFDIEPQSPKEINLNNLQPATAYHYHLFARPQGSDSFSLARQGAFQTRPAADSNFSFALFSDAHITPFNPERQTILSNISAAILARRPDFAVMLGDNIQTFTSHGGPMTDKEFGPVLYFNLRLGLADLPSSVPLFNVLGNWEGENGWHPQQQRQWARDARRAFIPTPSPETFPEGGGEFGDYYGFTWGDALFLVLTVTAYTPLDHGMGSTVGKPNDWTLGEKQKLWLHENLLTSAARWKIIFIHHTVGGNAGDAINSAYGRGGGRAARVGEQAQIHEWMKTYGVQALFYGHDHVFTDMAVDGIHYICVGSAGAPWKFDRAITGYDQYWTPSGYTWVNLTEDRLKIEFVNAENYSTAGEKILHALEISPQIKG